MAAVIAAESGEMLGIRSEVGNAGIDRPARTPHQRRKAVAARCLAWRFKHQPQSLLDQVLELAAAERELRRDR